MNSLTSSPVTDELSSGISVILDCPLAAPEPLLAASAENLSESNSTTSGGTADPESRIERQENVEESKSTNPLEKQDIQVSLVSSNVQPEVLISESKTPENPNVPCSQSVNSSEYIYHIKWIRFRTRSTPIITQNENGPCPLIAISNVLLLKSVISLPENTEVITGERLTRMLTDLLFSNPVQVSQSTLTIAYETKGFRSRSTFEL